MHTQRLGSAHANGALIAVLFQEHCDWEALIRPMPIRILESFAPYHLSKIVSLLAGVTAAVGGYAPNKPSKTGSYPMGGAYDQSFQEGYSILKHYGHNGPYSNRMSYGIGRDPPQGCAVDQVIMIHRHGERYLEGAAATKVPNTLRKVYSANVTRWSDELEFLNRWQYFIPHEGYIGLETYTGPYSGLMDAYRHGAEYAVRYGHLWDPTASNLTIPMFSAGWERVVQTGRKFAFDLGEGFFGWNYTDVVAMNIISEDWTQGANSLTPKCLTDEKLGSLKLNSTDVYNLMQMAAFELNVRGYSDWIDVFTLDEWVSFGYTQDLYFYYCAGPGNEKMKAVGSVYANATLKLLNEGPDKAGKMYWSFSHDTSITPIFAALGIAVPDSDLDLEHIRFPNEYQLGNIMPMGGHLTMERMACNATQVTAADTYVRLVLNEAVVPFSRCQNGPGFSCSLSNYTSIVSRSLLDFASTCGYNESYPQQLNFFWDYNTTKINNEQNGYIPYQSSQVYSQ
ncbi:3-phytase b [Trichoderma arundinaceum]|uniref:3-phytase b n=1 Tax=Trichoderma arundinaceum TaxID=490622 RepID=A0A395N790_TRIAR|nr:3-phytase b [Trichoderma arundinaceum]